MNPKDLRKYLKAFKQVQNEASSPIVAEAIIRKFGGGGGRGIRTLRISLSLNHRSGMQIPAYAWMNTVCKAWNRAIFRIALTQDFPKFVLDGKTVSVTVKGTTAKISANMVEQSK